MNQLKLSFTIALLAVFVFFTNCNKSQDAPVSNDYQNEYLDPIYQLSDLNEIENPSVEDADEVNKFKLRHPEKHDGLSPCEKQKENHSSVCKDCKDCKDCKTCKNCSTRNTKDGKGGDDKNTKDGKDDKNKDRKDGKDTDKKDGKGGDDKDKDGKGGNDKDRDGKGTGDKDKDRNDKDVKDRKETDKTKVDPNSLPFILKELNLTERQKSALDGFMKDYCDCISRDLKRADDINKGALDRANAKRDELIKAYKNGRISHAELMRQLKAIKDHINKDANSNNDKRAHLEVMKKCRENLYRNISSTLDSTQKDKFHRWVKNQK